MINDPEIWSACTYSGREWDGDRYMYYVNELYTDRDKCPGPPSRTEARTCALARGWNGVIHHHPEWDQLVYQVRPGSIAR